MGVPVTLGWVRNLFLRLYARAFAERCLLDEDILFRRIHPDLIHPDGTISKGAFRDTELSVDLARMATPERARARAKGPGYGLAGFSVAIARTLKQQVEHAPVPCNPAHTLVVGQKPQSIARKFAEQAKWVLKP